MQLTLERGASWCLATHELEVLTEIFKPGGNVSIGSSVKPCSEVGPIGTPAPLLSHHPWLTKPLSASTCKHRKKFNDHVSVFTVHSTLKFQNPDIRVF